ncbi:MAG: DNA repair protein [Bacteroidia bacterium]|nr:DNA repair protein [Bacteroidia bacterium]
MSKELNIISEIEIVFKKKIKSNQLPKVTSSAEAHSILRNVWSDKIELLEEFILLLFNNSNKCLGWVTISQGGYTGTVVENRLILATALKAAATGIMISHNHPSVNIKPSQQDITCTRKLKQCCELFDIALIDHIILSGDTEDYYSFADDGNI